MTGPYEVRFPDNIAYGATAGPSSDHGGGDRRRARAAQRRLGRGARPLGRVEGLKDQAQLDDLIAFFRARKGKAYGFRFKDWTDYKATGQLIGTGDGVIKTFQLVKWYPSGSVIGLRTITKPVARRCASTKTAWSSSRAGRST